MRRGLGQTGQERLAGFLFIAPALLYMLALMGYPIVYNFLLGFQDVSAFNLAAGEPRPFVGLANYRTVLADETMMPGTS